MPTTLIRVLAKSKFDQNYKFLCIYFGSFQIYMLVIVYHSVTYILYAKIFANSFCVFVVSVSDSSIVKLL